MNRGRFARIMAMTAVVAAVVPALAQEEDPVARLDEALRSSHAVVDTALLFTNLGNAPSKVRLVAFDASGAQAGSEEVEVPGNGLAYVLASELVDDMDPRRFIGKVVSRGMGRLTATAVLFGGALTDLPTIVNYGRTPISTSASQPYTAATFPLVVTY